MLEDVGAEAKRALEREAARLTEWLGGKRVLPRFPSPLSKPRGRGRLVVAADRADVERDHDRAQHATTAKPCRSAPRRGPRG